MSGVPFLLAGRLLQSHLTSLSQLRITKVITTPPRAVVKIRDNPSMMHNTQGQAEKRAMETSLVGRRLRIRLAGDMGLISGQGTRISHAVEPMHHNPEAVSHN